MPHNSVGDRQKLHVVNVKALFGGPKGKTMVDEATSALDTAGSDKVAQDTARGLCVAFVLTYTCTW